MRRGKGLAIVRDRVSSRRELRDGASKEAAKSRVRDGKRDRSSYRCKLGKSKEGKEKSALVTRISIWGNPKSPRDLPEKNVLDHKREMCLSL